MGQVQSGCSRPGGTWGVLHDGTEGIEDSCWNGRSHSAALGKPGHRENFKSVLGEGQSRVNSSAARVVWGRVRGGG